MAETKQNPISDLVNDARERLKPEASAQAEQLQKLEGSLQQLRARQTRFEEAVGRQLDELAKFEPPPSVSEEPLEKLLGSVRNLITATLPEQVLEALTEEAQQMGVRAAVFDVRGKAAWGASARGFGPQVTDKAFRALVVPLNQDGPFRQVYETGGHVDANAERLRKSRNLLDKIKPAPNGPILLVPVRSAGSVSAIFYADPGETENRLPVNRLKILAEFAGAQLDRLMALSGGVPAEAVGPSADGSGEPQADVTETVEAVEEAAEPQAAAPRASVAASAAVSAAPTVEAPTMPDTPPAAPPQPAAAAGFDLSQLGEEEQKCHRDAKRFAKLLVSEIELYNKTKVADGRKNKDVYSRLKSDIERSRQTYEKRFAKSVVKQVDYFHEELVRTLAANDPSLLGPGYPGPSA